MKTVILGLSALVFCSVDSAQETEKSADCNKHCLPIDLTRGADTAPLKTNHVHDDLSLGKETPELSLSKVRHDLARGKEHEFSRCKSQA